MIKFRISKISNTKYLNGKISNANNRTCNRLGRHVPGFAQEGGGGLKGPQSNPLQNQNLFGVGPLFLGGVHFKNEKIENNLPKKFDLGSLLDRYRGASSIQI